MSKSTKPKNAENVEASPEIETPVAESEPDSEVTQEAKSPHGYIPTVKGKKPAFSPDKFADELQSWIDSGESRSGSHADMGILNEVIAYLRSPDASWMD